MNVVAKDDSLYPKLLKELGDAPEKLYYKGTWNPELFEHCLAVVGTRRMTSYGKRVTEQLVGEIAATGITIVSGFMYGIDAAAHRAALRAGGRTIAVMPCGIEIIHPNDQKDLYSEILENGGLIVSEFAGTFLPTLWSYPKRNRIVAGLSQATMVVEAGENSGSLITANFAKKFGRKVFSVPGPLTSSVSVGILQLIREGSSVVTSAKDVVDFYEINSQFSISNFQSISHGPISKLSTSLEEKIIEQLRAEPKAIDELARMLEMPASKLGSLLSIMQLSGVITKEYGEYHAN